MQFGHLAYEGYDLFDPLNQVWEETKNQQGGAQRGSPFRETLALWFKYRWQAWGFFHRSECPLRQRRRMDVSIFNQFPFDCFVCLFKWKRYLKRIQAQQFNKGLNRFLFNLKWCKYIWKKENKKKFIATFFSSFISESMTLFSGTPWSHSHL